MSEENKESDIETDALVEAIIHNLTHQSQPTDIEAVIRSTYFTPKSQPTHLEAVIRSTYFPHKSFWELRFTQRVKRLALIILMFFIYRPKNSKGY